QILSFALLLEFSGQQPGAAAAIRQAVERVISAGVRTADLATPGGAWVGTMAMAEAVAEAI
ncbi:MAG: isocitrate/isopropylmalate family dehydrogenase, partial [Verrucomicrobiia bacterium]